MAKITMEITDQLGQVGIDTTIEGYDETSNAVRMTEKIMLFLDRIAERQGKPELMPKLIEASQEAHKRLGLQHLADSVIVRAD